MFIPLHDKNSLKYIKLQYVTISLITANCLVWLFTGLLAPETVNDAATIGLGYIPAVAFNYAYLPPDLALVPHNTTYLTYSFLHLDFWHLAGNMLFLWVFGDNVEDAMGHFRFLVFYLACAVAGAFFHGLLSPSSEAPLVGASGAISGVVAAYMMLHPKVRVWVLVLFRFPLPLPAFIPLLFWVGQQFFMLLTDTEGRISWGAHVGGIIAGAILVLFMRRRGVPLFDTSIVTPKAVRHAEAPADPLAGETRTPPHWGRG
ncbi:rhomboid family intramembrane serine protease [Metarhizobium album]|uniref:Rhomboid family intramembrane serine protease n=1 Tax=Metarhizobium album TaxID=2182425 RepID=A0A2U2DNX9_9HYPH|nr:rhomboid family intramembrane serine protease [Rhizobium album]PWE55016.1 rhomboid family intramembrane serine protease [Rhizobium album]